MTERHSFISATLAELSRRKVLRTVGGYAVAVFVLLQLMDAAVEPLRLPEWVPTLVVLTLILGFPIVFFLAWHLDIRSDGIHRTQRAGLLTRGQSAVLFFTMLLLTGGLASVFYQYYSSVFAQSDSIAQETSAPPAMFSAPANSIAVLPFSDLSPAGDQAHFADGISEEILNLLAQVDGLHVAARTSSFSFRDQAVDVREIGRLLNVRTVLEGSIRTAGDRIRLTAQLINVEDGYHIWSQDYDREVTDIFAIQDEVAANIATALVDSFSGLSTRQVQRSDSLAASQAYRTGRLHWWRRTPAELQRAIELFAVALEQDARFAPAYAAMADTWLLLSLYGNVDTLKATNKAQAMIDKALAIDPQSGEAFAALGLARWQIGQLDAAESALRQAVELNANYVPAHLWLAGVLGQQGRYPEEHLVLDQALSIDPLNELLAINYASNLSMRGQWKEARERLQELVSLRPDSSMLLRSMAGLEMQNGNLYEGWRLADRAHRLQPDNPEDIAAMAGTWMMLGDSRQAETLILGGLEQSEGNNKLLQVYWKNLMMEKRYEKAESLVREEMEQMGDAAPPALQAGFKLRLGMIAIAREDFAQGHELLRESAEDMEGNTYSDERILTMTLAAMAADRLGEAELAGHYLAEAERMVDRARINGVDSPDIYYTEAVLLTLRKNPAGAVAKLEQAVDRGFRGQWMLEVDSRIQSLRDADGYALLKNRIEQDIEDALGEIRALNLAML